MDCIRGDCSVDSPEAVQSAMRLPEEFEEASGGDVEGMRFAWMIRQPILARAFKSPRVIDT